MDPRPVEVLHEGRWLPGWIKASRREPDGTWRALVEYRDDEAMVGWYHWRPYSELRPRSLP